MREVNNSNNPYLLLTPGPLSTTDSVKEAMMKDWCTWDDSYNNIVQNIRQQLISLATKKAEDYTAVLMQGSGTFSVESVIGTVIPRDGKLLVIANGAYGKRIAQIAETLQIALTVLESDEMLAPDLAQVEQTLIDDESITHVAVVHCETTTGMLNPIEKIGEIVKRNKKIYIVDAMSSFGGITMDIAELGIDYLISSANKCIQGVPGFGFIIARKSIFETCSNQARSLSLDLYDQWKTMEENNGKWRFTSPTHTVRAFSQALAELEQEGGISSREERYETNHRTLVDGMRELGFKTLLADENQSPIITSFHYPESKDFQFQLFYEKLKARGYVIYPGKVTDLQTFRIGNIGEVYKTNISNLIEAIKESMYWLTHA